MTYALDLTDTDHNPWAQEGFDSQRQGWIFPRPINAHTHLRSPYEQGEPEIFDLVVPISAQIYSWVTAMPNLKQDRIRTIQDATIYKEHILRVGRKHNPHFDVTVPFYIEPNLDLKEIENGFKDGVWKAGKLYPKGGTHHSDEGVDFLKIRELWPLFDVMQRCGIRLLIHGEVVRYENSQLIPDRLREEFAINVIDDIFENFPKLHASFEHISSHKSVPALQRWQKSGFPVEATIAPQYLLMNGTALTVGGMNPGDYSIPILKDEEDRLAILKFMLEGGGMLGTDSAPHDLYKKSQPRGCPGGIFNEPVALFVYFHLFRAYGGEGWFEKFKQFACFKAAKFYDLPIGRDFVIIREQDQEIPALYKNGDARIMPMFSGMTIPYILESL